jgi:hypothetical protein
MEAVAANVTTLRSTTINVTTIATTGSAGIGTSTFVYQTQIYGNGQQTAALTDAGNKGGSLLLNTPTVSGGDGGALLIGAGGVTATPFAAIKGLLVNGGGNTTGSLAFSTRNATADTALTERMRIDSSGNVGIGTASPSFASGLGVALNGGASQTRLAFKNTYTGDASTDGVQFALIAASSGFLFQNRESDGSFAWETNSTERMRIDSVGNTYVETGNLWQYSPAPTALAAGANAGTAAQLLGGMFSAAQTTAVTLTMPTGTAIDTGFPSVPAVDIGFYFYVINTGSALGAVTVAVNTNVTSLGSLVVAIGTSAQFRLRRTAANTYVMYRLS